MAGASAALAGSGGAGGSTSSGNPAAAGSGAADPNDLGNLIPDLGNPGGNTGNTTPPAAGSCQDLVCFDVFDCVLWHPDEAATCNFTACEGFVCK